MKFAYNAIVLYFLVSFAAAEFEQLDAAMPTARSDMTSVVVGDNIIVAGGCVTQACTSAANCTCSEITAVVEAFVPSSQSWVVLPDMPAARFRHGAAVIGTKMFVIGGRDVFDEVQKTTFVFDWNTQNWTILPQIWEDPSSDLVAASFGNLLFAISGYSATYETLARTCVLNTEDPNASWGCGKIAAMSQTRGDACGIALNGKIYVFGGYSDSDWCAPLPSLEVYDPLTNEWQSKPDMHVARGDCACASLHGEFHAMGGETKDGDCTSISISDVEHFDVNKNAWIEEDPLDIPTFRFSGASYEGAFYVFGGQGSYDPETLSIPIFSTVLAYGDTSPEFSSASSLSAPFVVVIALIWIMF
eukprot:TRINITY_DN136_c0_g1_i1.p1 TRINITY_DN136_c0_g1~~TRINITY_DN136_c0_g1_i1.p1  ORF type:complete len:359 (-),score=70.23 TRINITY_DN136_c0_g1_i1:39-1115(-)